MKLGRALIALVATTAMSACRPYLPTSSVGSASIPTLAVHLGTVDVGDGKTFRVSVPVTPEQRRLMSSRSAVYEVHCNSFDLRYAGMGPGYVLLAETTHHMTGSGLVGTTAAVLEGGNEVLNLDLKIQLRRAFELTAITRGKRYALKLAPGFDPPVVVDHSSGLLAAVERTGDSTAELVISRTAPPLVPGGALRLLDRTAGDTQTIEILPMPSVEVFGSTTGEILNRRGELVVSANGPLTPDKPDVEVVLDPPGAYEIVRRGYAGGKLTLTLIPLTRKPSDLRIGYRRRGRWVEVHQFTID